MNTLIDILKSLGTGFVCGAIFALLRLPVPAPVVLPGIAGIVGLSLGYMVIMHFKK